MLNRSVEDRLGRAQDEIADLGRELLEIHQRMESILKILESGSPGSVPPPLLVEERLLQAEARLRRLESALSSREAGHASALRALAGRTRRSLTNALRGLARRTFRTVKAARSRALPPSDWIFETRLVRRETIPLPALTIVAEGGEEETKRVRAWLSGQTVRDVELVTRIPGSPIEETVAGGRWVCRLPSTPPDVPPTFLEEHLWSAACEDLAFTTTAEESGAAVVLVRRDLLDEGALDLQPSPAAPGPTGAVFGRSLAGFAGVAWPRHDEQAAPLSRAVRVGDLWVRRGSYVSGKPLERALTPLDGVLPHSSGSTEPAAPTPRTIVALVASRAGWTGMTFADGLARTLEPSIDVVLVDTDERERSDPAVTTGTSSFYSVGCHLPPSLRLSAIERVVRSRPAPVVVDLRWQTDPLSLSQAIRLRNRGFDVVPFPFDAGAESTAGPPCLPPVEGVTRPAESARRTARESLGIPEGCLAVVLADTLDEDSGLFEFLKAAGSLEGQGGWFFVVAGGGPLRPMVRQLSASRGLGALRLAGPETSLDNAIVAADVFCLPGEGPFRPHLLLQALARGVPTVAGSSSAGALSANGAVIDSGSRPDAERLATALGTLAAVGAREDLSALALSASREYVDRVRPQERWREWAAGPRQRRP